MWRIGESTKWSLSLQHTRCRVNLGLYFMYSNDILVQFHDADNFLPHPGALTATPRSYSCHLWCTEPRQPETHGAWWKRFHWFYWAVPECLQTSSPSSEQQSWLGRRGAGCCVPGCQSRQAVCALPPCPAARLCTPHRHRAISVFLLISELIEYLQILVALSEANFQVWCWLPLPHSHT